MRSLRSEPWGGQDALMGKVDQGEAAPGGQPDGHADIITPGSGCGVGSP